MTFGQSQIAGGSRISSLLHSFNVSYCSSHDLKYVVPLISDVNRIHACSLSQQIYVGASHFLRKMDGAGTLLSVDFTEVCLFDDRSPLLRVNGTAAKCTHITIIPTELFTVKMVCEGDNDDDDNEDGDIDDHDDGDGGPYVAAAGVTPALATGVAR